MSNPPALASVLSTLSCSGFIDHDLKIVHHQVKDDLCEVGGIRRGMRGSGMVYGWFFAWDISHERLSRYLAILQPP